MRTRLTLAEGWRRSPPWMKAALAAFATVNFVSALALLLIRRVPVPVTLAALTILVIVQLAFIGTVTDVYAAPLQERTQRVRSLVIGLALLLLVGMFFVATIVRLGSNVANRVL